MVFLTPKKALSRFTSGQVWRYMRALSIGGAVLQYSFLFTTSIWRLFMTPGLYIKRWMLLCAVGTFMTYWGLHRIRDEMAKYEIKYNLQFLLIGFGLAFVLFGLYKLISSALKYAGFTRRALLARLVDESYLALGPKIVVIGGGTGLATLLAGLK